MATLQQVHQGLQRGRVFERDIDAHQGYERLTPVGEGKVNHYITAAGVSAYSELPVDEVEDNASLQGKWRRAS